MVCGMKISRRIKKELKSHEQLSNFENMAISAGNTASKSSEEEKILRTILMFEQQILIAKHVNSNAEGRQWLSSLIQFLVAKGEEKRLKRFVMTLITSTETEYFGAPRLEILQEMLKTVSTNINLQRLYMGFKQQIEWLENRK